MRAGFLGGRDLELGLVAQQEHSGVQYEYPVLGQKGTLPPASERKAQNIRTPAGDLPGTAPEA